MVVVNLIERQLDQSHQMCLLLIYTNLALALFKLYIVIHAH